MAKIEVATERVVRSGDTIRTNSTGRAIVTYRDGSTVLLDVDSELVIELIGAQDGDIVVRMRQTLGRAWYSVSRALSAGRPQQGGRRAVRPGLPAGPAAHRVARPLPRRGPPLVRLRSAPRPRRQCQRQRPLRPRRRLRPPRYYRR